MKEIVNFLGIVTIVISATVCGAESTHDTVRAHTLTWKLSGKELNSPVLTWIFDGREMKDSEADLNTIESIPLSKNDIIDIQVQLCPNSGIFPPGYFMADLIGFWYHKKIQFQISINGEKTKLSFVTWSGVDRDQDPAGAKYLFDGADIGSDKEAQSYFERVNVDKSSVVLIISPFKSTKGHRVTCPPLLRKFQFSCEQSGAHVYLIEAYDHPLTENYPWNAFPGSIPATPESDKSKGSSR